MRRRLGNVWAHAAARILAVGQNRGSVSRAALLMLLVFTWLGAGLTEWGHLGPQQAFYRTLALLQPGEQFLETESQFGVIAVWAGLSIPVVLTLFLYSEVIGRHLAQLYFVGASGHVVILGGGRQAVALAHDCRGSGDAVSLVSDRLAADTAHQLRRRGVDVREADPKSVQAIRSARARYCSHAVVLGETDSENLQISAALHRVADGRPRKAALVLHRATLSPLLMREAREMYAARLRRKSDKREAIEVQVFSPDELVARAFVWNEAGALLDLAQRRAQSRVHLVFVGFDRTAEAITVWVMRTLWSAHFEAPRITILVPDPEGTEIGFRARYVTAFVHPHIWCADIAFLPFDWDAVVVNATLMEMVEEKRGAFTAIVVATQSDVGNVQLAMALLRVCNTGMRWPVPIFLHEPEQTDLAVQFDLGDTTEELDAYISVMGSHEAIRRATLIDGRVDRIAAMMHLHYHLGVARRSVREKDLQRQLRDWPEVADTYRDANRAVADSAIVKLWDVGRRLTDVGSEGCVVTSELLRKMARREHDRWMASRFFSGWQPPSGGLFRDNSLRVHDKLVPWESLSESDQDRDAEQVRAALDVLCAVHHTIPPISYENAPP